MRWKLTMSSSDSLSSWRSLRSGARRTAGRPCRFDTAHVPAGALDADHFDIFAQHVLDRGLHGGVAAAMQHHARVAAQQARGVGAHRQIFIDALGGVIGGRDFWRLRQLRFQRDCMVRDLSSILEKGCVSLRVWRRKCRVR